MSCAQYMQYTNILLLQGTLWGLMHWQYSSVKTDMCVTSAQPAAAKYYTQRAFKGSFQLSEGTVVSPYGHGCVAG